MNSPIQKYSIKLVREPEFSLPRFQVRSPEDVYHFTWKNFFQDEAREVFAVLGLSQANTIDAFYPLTYGGLTASIVEPRQVFQALIAGNHAAFICVHNHPSGNPEPSREDIRLTRSLVEAGKLMQIPCHDHVIVTEITYTSLAERGLIIP